MMDDRIGPALIQTLTHMTPSQYRPLNFHSQAIGWFHLLIPLQLMKKLGPSRLDGFHQWIPQELHLIHIGDLVLNF